MIKKFQFKLNKVLEMRKAKENESLRALALARQANQAELEKKLYWISQLQAALARRELLAKSPMPGAAFLIENDSITGSKVRIIQSEQGIVRTHRLVEKAFRVYLFSRSQVRALEVLRDKAYLEHKKELAKQESKEMADLELMRFRLKGDPL